MKAQKSDATAAATAMASEPEPSTQEQKGTSIMAQSTDNPTSWRDLITQLTAEQVAYLENESAREPSPPRADGSSPSVEEHEAYLLFTAREFCDQNALAVRFRHIDPPSGIVGSCDAWQEGDGDSYLRYFVGQTRDAGDGFSVEIGGEQYSDGRVARYVRVIRPRSSDGEMSAELARQVAAVMVDAADEVDCLSGLGDPEVSDNR